MATRKSVSAGTVRTWAKSNLSKFDAALHPSIVGTPGKAGPRGRLHPSVIEAFHKANKSMRYETASDAERPTVTFKYATQNARGANITKTVTLLTSEARALLGHAEGTKGRFNIGALSEAYAASQAASKAA